jgi:hypothetical protein
MITETTDLVLRFSIKSSETKVHSRKTNPHRSQLLTLQPSDAEARLNIIYKFSPYRKESACLQDNDQLGKCCFRKEEMFIPRITRNP